MQLLWSLDIAALITLGCVAIDAIAKFIKTHLM